MHQKQRRQNDREKQEKAKFHIDFTWQKNEDNNKNQNLTVENFSLQKIIFYREFLSWLQR